MIIDYTGPFTPTVERVLRDNIETTTGIAAEVNAKIGAPVFHQSNNVDTVAAVALVIIDTGIGYAIPRSTQKPVPQADKIIRREDKLKEVLGQEQKESDITLTVETRPL
jgi:hypothetical protein